MKRLLLYALVLLFASCSKDPGLTYSDKNGVYFAYSYKQRIDNINTRIIQFDTVTYSFGMLDESIIKDTARIAVNVMGNAADKDRFYRVAVNPDSTTAVEGEHYETIQPLQKIRANRFVDTLKIVVLRKKLSGSHITRENKRIGLKIEQSDDFNVGITRGAQIQLVINNYLSEPKWWKKYALFGLYFYHPEKWKVLMKFHDSFKNPDSELPMDVNLVGAYFNSLRSYLNNTPTYDKETGERVLIDRLVK